MVTLNQIDVRYIPFMKCYTLYPPICYQHKCPAGANYNCNHATVIDIKNFVQIYIKYLYLIQIISIIILSCYKKKIKKIIGIFIIVNILVFIVIYLLPIYKV